ncbi:tetratricopeptide repeat protein [Streptomyces sp. 3R004]|nr:tetratricopeptide repeat protein [Streptomyces justiciae]
MAKATSRPARDRGPEPSVTVTDTGQAVASGEETAVTGFQGPAPGSGSHAPQGPVHVSGTGHATATHGGTAISGYVHELTVHQRLPQNPAPWPHQVGVIPSAARSFQYRAESHRLRTQVEDGGTTVLTQLLTGMGGVGKTQLAADYARAAWEDTSATGGLDVLVWITASTRSPIITGYAQAGVELCRADPGDAEQAARSFLAWLTPKAGAKPCRWLIVLDDVTDPNDLKGLWPPHSPHGRTLVTTRRRDAALTADGRHTVEVGLFTPAEALSYLTAALTGHNRDDSADQLSALADDLGYLPLALAQAAAYLLDTNDTVAAYRERLADRTTSLADTAPEALPDEQALPLAAAWSLSVEHADILRPAGVARSILQLASLLDANGIPQDVMTSRPALAHFAARRVHAGEKQPGQPAPLTPQDAVHALRALHKLSLIDHTPASPHQEIRVHQLIQRATRDTLISHQRDQAARTAADALLAVWPEVERDTDLAQALRANTTALTSCAEDALYHPDAHVVLFRMGNSLGGTGQVAAAIEHYQCILRALGQRFGEDHLDTLDARARLASWRGKAGDAAGAMAVFAEVLERLTRLMPSDHPYVLTARHDLATWQGRAGDVAAAADAFANLLPDRIRVFGSNHPDTLANRHNLAWWRGEAGDPAGARLAFEELLPDQTRVLGHDHPYTLTTRHDLARCRGEAGDAAGAADALADLLLDQIRVLGQDHPDTLTTRHNLARWRGRAGDPAGAAGTLADLLPDQLRILGEEHPDTLTTRGYMAYWRGAAGDPAGAADALADLLRDQTRILGQDHPDTLVTRGNLAQWQGRAGDPATAADALADLLAHKTRVLGDKHPHTLATRQLLAHWREQSEQTAAHPMPGGQQPC